jgi:hypothetical protein
MQLEIQYAWKLYSAMPSTAYLRIALPETTYTTTVNDFFNTFVSFPVTNFDNCQNPPVPATYTKFSGYRSTQYPIKLLFVRIPRTGDTLRFTLHDNVDIPVTILSGDSSQGWSISNSVDPQNVQCWTAPDKLEASSSVFKYADTVFVGFRVKPDVDAIFYGAATPVRATAVNSSGNEVYIDAGTQVLYTAAPTYYGKFIKATGDTTSSPIVQSYSDARNGKVWYVSDKRTISDSLHSITIAAAKNQDTTVRGNGTVTIKSEWIVFDQCHQTWSDSAYDFEPGATICGKGCALSCMTMILKRYGYNVDPGTLNAWMKDPTHLGYDPGGNVHWNVPQLYSNNAIKLKALVVNDDGSPLDLAKLDNYSDSRWSTIVQVDHGGSTHYVLVIGKNTAGQYVTIDPRFPHPSTLLDYRTNEYPNGKILKIIPYRKN